MAYVGDYPWDDWNDDWINNPWDDWIERINQPRKYEYHTYIYEPEKEEKKVSLIKRYVENKRDDDENLAIKMGAFNGDGTLTQEGKDLLLQLLLEDKAIKEKFYQVLDQLHKGEN